MSSNRNWFIRGPHKLIIFGTSKIGYALLSVIPTPTKDVDTASNQFLTITSLINTQSSLSDMIWAVLLWLLIGGIILWIYPGKHKIDKHFRKELKNNPGKESIPFYYKVLGVGKNSSLDEIKSSYQQLVKIYHPDVSAEKDAERKFREIRIAYETLSDPEKRALYDRFEDNFK